MDDVLFYIIIGVLLVLIVVLAYLLPRAKAKGIGEVFALFIEGAYDSRVKWFKTLNKYVKDGGIVFVGDSITQEYLLTEMLSGYNVYNRGIGGDTTNGVLKRMNESIFDLNPKQMFLLIGTNDLELTNNSNEQIVANIEEICRKAIEFNSEMLITIIPILHICEVQYSNIDPNTVGNRTNKKIDEINSQLIELCKKENYSSLDINVLLTDESGNLKQEYTREGLHLTQEAYELITSKLKEIL